MVEVVNSDLSPGCLTRGPSGALTRRGLSVATLVLATWFSVSSTAQTATQVVGLGSVSAVYDLEFVPPYLFALERGRLLVLERDEPTHFREVARLEVDPPSFRLARHGHRLLLTGFAPLAVVDIADPLRPRWLGRLDGSANPWADAFEVAGDLGFLMVRDSATEISLRVLDLSNSIPSEISRVDLGLKEPGWQAGLAADSERVWVLSPGPRTGGQGSLAVVDVSDSAEPRVERIIRLPEGRHFTDVEVVKPLVFLLIEEDEDGLALFEDTGDGKLVFLGEVVDPQLWGPIDLLARGPTVFATFKGPIDVAAFSYEGLTLRPILRHAIPDLWAAGIGMTVADGQLFVSGDGGPSPIFDVSDPGTPRFLGYWDYNGGWAGPMARIGELMLVANVGGGYFVFDLSNPRNPRRLARITSVHGSRPDEYHPTVILAGEGVLAVAAYESGTAEVLDLSDPSQPKVRGEFPVRGLVLAADISDSVVFLGYRSVAQGRTPEFWDSETFTQGGGIQVVEISTPAEPRSLAHLDLGAPVTDVARIGRWLLAAHADGGLTALDIADKVHPEVAGRWPGSGAVDDIPTRTGRVAIGGSLNRVAVTHRGDGNSTSLSILDFSDLTNPRLRARLTLPAQSFPQTLLAMDGDWAVLFDGSLVVVDVSNPDEPQIALRQSLPVTEDWLEEWMDLTASGGFAYLSMNERGLWVFELPSRASRSTTRQRD